MFRLSVLTAVVLATVVTLSAGAQDRPNIIIVLSDDMGYSDIGCYGGEIETPTLDGLAENGLRFTQFYNTGRCCPTRACLLSGLYPHQAGVGWMMTDRGHDGYCGDLNKRCQTIAEVLRPAGYSTYGVGKWHVTKQVQPDGSKHNWPLQRGFEKFYGTITGAGSFFDPGTLTRGNQNISPFTDPEYQPEEFYYTNAINDHAVRFVDAHFQENKADKPFFMYVAHTAAHWPMHALPRDIAKYKGKYDEGYAAIRDRRAKRVVELGLVKEDWGVTPLVGDWDKFEHKEWEAANMEVYAAMVDCMDQGIGRITEALKRNSEFENTLIFFLQDNGGCQEGVGRKGDFKRPVEASMPKIAADAIRLGVIPKQNRAGVPTLTGPGITPGPEDTYIAYGINWANVSNTPFREYKHFVHEGGVSTPLIAHWPERIKRHGELEHQPGHLIDLMATCVDVSGATYPSEVAGEAIQPMEGVSLRPAFTGNSLDRPSPIFWEHESNRAIRSGKWKLVAKENRPWELYNMETDRTEMHDLADKETELVEKLSVEWDTWAKRANVLPLGAWRGQKKTTQLNRKQRKFELKGGAALPQAKAPFLQGRAVEVTVSIDKGAENGVLIAQGGTAHGFSLYVKNSILTFATRHDGKLVVVKAAQPLDAGPVTVTATLSKDGTVELHAGEGRVGRGSVSGPLSQMPIDGLQVGQDANGAVGEYSAPFPFEGKIASAGVILR